MYHNGSNLTIPSAVVQWPKPRTLIIEKASSNHARRFVVFLFVFFSSKLVSMLPTDMTENSRKA